MFFCSLFPNIPPDETIEISYTLCLTPTFLTKTKTMRINSTNKRPIKLNNEDIENVASFTYLGSVIAVDGGTERDVQARIGKVRTAFLLLRPVRRSKEISLRTKLRIFNTNVKSALMCGAETWRVTKKLKLSKNPSLHKSLPK